MKKSASSSMLLLVAISIMTTFVTAQKTPDPTTQADVIQLALCEKYCDLACEPIGRNGTCDDWGNGYVDYLCRCGDAANASECDISCNSNCPFTYDITAYGQCFDNECKCQFPPWNCTDDVCAVDAASYYPGNSYASGYCSNGICTAYIEAHCVQPECNNSCADTLQNPDAQGFCPEYEENENSCQCFVDESCNQACTNYLTDPPNPNFMFPTMPRPGVQGRVQGTPSTTTDDSATTTSSASSTSTVGSMTTTSSTPSTTTNGSATTATSSASSTSTVGSSTATPASSTPSTSTVSSTSTTTTTATTSISAPPTTSCAPVAAPVKPAASCPSNGNLVTDAQRQSMVDQHNALRSNLTKGLQKNMNGTFKPSGTNMYYLEWDCQLELNAQAWSNQCNYTQSTIAERPNQGENMYEAPVWNNIGDPLDIQFHFNAAANLFWAEVTSGWMAKADTIFPDPSTYPYTVGHYTQSACVYEIGTPCNNCNSTCTTDMPSTCDTNTGLCVINN